MASDHERHIKRRADPDVEELEPGGKAESSSVGRDGWVSSTRMTCIPAPMLKVAWIVIPDSWIGSAAREPIFSLMWASCQAARPATLLLAPANRRYSGPQAMKVQPPSVDFACTFTAPVYNSAAGRVVRDWDQSSKNVCPGPTTFRPRCSAAEVGARVLPTNLCCH
jgi:hypothetical protein